MLKHFLGFLACHRGAIAIEYGLIASAIAVGIVGVLLLLGDNLQLIFEIMGNAGLIRAE